MKRCDRLSHHGDVIHCKFYLYILFSFSEILTTRIQICEENNLFKKTIVSNKFTSPRPVNVLGN